MNSTTFVLLCAMSFGLFFTKSWGKVCITKEGPKLYDMEKKMCCNGIIYVRLANQECCGNDIINKKESLCCEGKAWPRFVDSFTDGKRLEQKCCGSYVIFGDQTECCHGDPVTLTEDQNRDREYLECCSAGIIADSRVEKCCGGKAMKRNNHTDCCAGEQFDKRSHWCANKFGQKVKLAIDQMICRDITYTVTEKSCCYGVLNHTVPQRDSHDKFQSNPHFGCCESKVIDPTKEKCCFTQDSRFKSHPIPKGPAFECCGDGYFDPSCQACLNGLAVNKRPGQIECGSSLIDPLHEGCCASYMPYNKTSEKCCLGSLSSVISKHQNCCNGVGYGEDQLCCENAKPVKRNSMHDNCCFNEVTGEGQTFNTLEEKCNEGHVVVVAPHLEVCGNLEYNPMTQLCCKDGGTKYERYNLATSGYNQCCGITPYNNQSQSCCYGRLFEIPTREALCCFINYKAYTYHDISSPCTRKCSGGNSLFDIEEETCCDGVVHPYRSRYSCCGPFYYRNKGRGRRGKKSFKCCNKGIYSEKTSECKNGEIQSRPGFKDVTSTQAICHRPLWKSVDGVVNYACTSKYALFGKLRRSRMVRKAAEKVTYVEMRLTRIKVLPIRLADEGWKRPDKLKIHVHVSMDSSTKCTKRRVYRDKSKVAVFFDAPVKGRSVTIQSQDRFRIVDYEKVFRKLRKYGVKGSFCEQSYSYATLKYTKRDKLIPS